MTTGVEVVTALVVIGKVAVVSPARTATLEGTVTAVGSLLVSVTIAPPVGAAAVSVTVPVAVPSPTTLMGLTTSDVTVGSVVGGVVGVVGAGGVGAGGAPIARIRSARDWPGSSKYSYRTTARSPI